MTAPPEPAADLPGGEASLPVFLIRVKGCLGSADWGDWFGPIRISIDQERGETLLEGPVADQAELYGLLSRLRDLALPLLLVQRLDAFPLESNPGRFP